MTDKPNTDRAPDAQASEAEQRDTSLVGKRVLFSENDFSDDGLFAADVMEASPTGAHLRVRYLNGSMKWITASSLGSRGWYVREVLGNAAREQRDNAPQPAAPDAQELHAKIVDVLVRAKDDEAFGEIADRIIKLVEIRNAALLRMNSRYKEEILRLESNAQPAPVAQGDALDWQLVERIGEMRHEGLNDETMAREIHAEYERRAALQREQVAKLAEQLKEDLRGALINSRERRESIRSALDALAKHEEKTT